MVIPQSPEADTFRCGRCGHEWSEPAAPVRAKIPNDALPREASRRALWIRVMEFLKIA